MEAVTWLPPDSIVLSLCSVVSPFLPPTMTTQRTIASSEELNQMPPSPAKACMLCWRQEADGVLLLRCGTCKNQVYCVRSSWRQVL